MDEATAQAVAGWAVTQLIYAAERIDHGDFAGVAELFEHATLTFEGFDNEVTGREAIETLYAHTTRRYEDGRPSLRPDDQRIGGRWRRQRALTSRSYFTVLQAVPGHLTLQPVITGRYRHTFRRVDGHWRVETMRVMIELVGELGHHLLFDLAP